MGGKWHQSWKDPSGPLLRAIFFPGVTELLGGPSELRQSLCQHHLPESCLQHLEVVDVFVL